MYNSEMLKILKKEMKKKTHHSCIIVVDEWQ